MLVALALTTAACGGAGDKGADAGSSPSGDELVVQAANYELVAGEESRFIAGLLLPDGALVGFGAVDIEFFYLGTREGEGTAEPGPTVTADFLAIEGDPGSPGPAEVSGSEGRGVYAAEVTFDRAGFWAAQVTADLETGPVEGRAVFEVLEEHVFPAVGDPAPKTDNLTLASKDAPREAIDSRARDGEPIPDPELHQTTVAGSVKAGRPALVVIATPVYCVSRFCGPITDMVGELQREYADRADFIHIEVWRDFENTVVNKGAADFIYRNDDLLEPWVFFIDEGGRIAARWDNVATRAEIEPFLQDLPKRK